MIRSARRVKPFKTETRPLLEDSLEQVIVEFLAAKGLVVLLEVEHVVDHEADVTERGAIGVHGRYLPGRGFGADFTRNCCGAP